MKDSSYIIRENVQIASGVWKMWLEGDTSEIIRAGQFVDVAVEGFFLRRPFAATEWDEKGFSIIYKVVGAGTEKMSRMAAGENLKVLTGLGNGFDINACDKTALVVCGGLGTSPVYSLVKNLRQKGTAVTVVMGFNTVADVFLYDEMVKTGADVYVTTMDGSKGIKGLVTDAIRTVNLAYEYFYCCGPKVMMKAVCECLDGPGEVSLEERMGCGCGICYGCTCHTNSGPKRVCKNGPVFKKEDVIW